MIPYRIALLLGLAAAAAGTVAAQGRVLSPPMSTSVSIEGKNLRVDYGAPSMRGRKIMGGLVPYGEVWCAGANDSTTLVTDADLEIAGMKVPKGSYSVWVVPNKTEWTLILNKQTGQWHTEYHPNLDFGRVKMSVKTLPSPVEVFKIQLSAAGGNRGTLSLIWETTEASVPFSAR